jgi:hypothetical protein
MTQTESLSARLARYAPTLTLAALAAFVWRTLLDFRFVAEVMPSSDAPAVFAISALYTAIIIAWAWAVRAVARGSRPWAIVALALAVVVNLGQGLGTLFVFCPTPCQTVWPVGEMANWTLLVAGLASALALAMRLRARSA